MSKVPCSSANLGPGFDVIGLALSLYLKVHVTITPNTPSPHPLNCKVTYSGVGADSIDLDARNNLITRTALYLLKCHDISAFPASTHVYIDNPIPLGRGLGSSGAAVVAGVLLGNLFLPHPYEKARLLDYCLMVERHPDNVAAALYGGFVGTYLNELDPKDMVRIEVPLSETLGGPAGSIDTGLKPPIPPENIGHFHRFRWNPEIKAVAIIPDFEVSTAKAREVLPKSYSRSDMVVFPSPKTVMFKRYLTDYLKIFNLQRLALLTTVLGDSPPDPSLIYSAMQDKIHQPYRKDLIPGLTTILRSITPTTHKGLLGICLSGAGPTILALATENFGAIARAAITQFAAHDIACEWRVLTPAEDGATVTEVADEY
ncbi:hypothetical protein DV736_g2553, partial [Chaetothyriales sp. CBS 134916]